MSVDLLQRLVQRSLAIGLLMISAGCLPASENEVVIYSALDREFSQPILEDLGSEMRLTIRSKFDQESNKTVGLATELIQRQKNPQADVFWNNEILHTIRLQRLGLLEPVQIKTAKRFPVAFQSPTGHWYGFAARGRVLIVNTDLLPDRTQWPASVTDLANKKWQGKCAMARPVFGTTATHAAVLLATMGDKRGMKLLQAVGRNAIIKGGNKQVAQAVAAGEYYFGLTDTDDAIIEIEQGQPVAMIFPDQGDHQPGMLIIPNTLAIIKNGPNPRHAKALLQRLLSADIERRLATGRSAQSPLASDVDDQLTLRRWLSLPASDIQPVDRPRLLTVDFAAAADAWDEHKQQLQAIR